MSSTKRGGKRLDNDQYWTPQWAIDQCLAAVVPNIVSSPSVILEPSAGDGRFAAAIKASYPKSRVIAVEYKPLVPQANMAGVEIVDRTDFLGYDPGVTPELIIGNPPYQLALEFCQRALRVSRCVIFLLRLGFLASQKRYSFFSMMPPTAVHVLSKRPSFYRGTTDSADYCWVCWSASKVGPTQMHWLGRPKP